MSNERVIETNTSVGESTFTVMANGNEVPDTTQILAMSVNNEVNHIPTARLVIRDGDPSEETFEISNSDDFKPGNEIEIKTGYDGEEETVFKGIIIKQGIKIYQHKGSVLEVECKHKAIKMTVGNKNRYLTGLKDSEAIEEIFGKYDFSADVEATDVSHPDLIQFYTPDWDFIKSRAHANSQLILCNNKGEISIKQPTFDGEAALTLIHGSTIFELEAEMDAREQYQSVKATSWDYSSQELFEEEGEAESYKQGNISEDDLAAVLGVDGYNLNHAGFVEDTELKSWADAEKLKSHLSKIRGSVKCRGNTKVAPGDMIELKGLGDRFNGKAYVTGVRQVVDDNNWFTHIQFGLPSDWFNRGGNEGQYKPASNLLPAVHGLQIGKVTQLQDDPNGEDRILVKMPVTDNTADGVWARVASLDAGENRGAFFRPEIDDEVVVGFLNDDPRDPVVLGMLNSSRKPAPLNASDDNHKKGFVTRSEMEMIFDDDKKSFTIETPNGNKLVLSDDEGGITFEDENGNKVMLNSDGITLNSAKDIIQEASSNIDLKASADANMEGTNVSHKANAQYKAEGSAGAEMTSSAIAKIEGSMVQIN